MDFSSFVGLPWRDKGRRRDGADCWGLCCIVYGDLLGISLPSHAEGYATAADREETAAVFAGERGDWLDVARGAEKPFDVAALCLGGGYHVGIVTGAGRMLHMPRGKSSVIERLARFPPELISRHRHRLLA